MKRIQTRVMALFLILILLMNGISFILYHLSQQTIDQYDEMLKRFLLYNDISNRSSGLVDELQAYLTDKSLSFYESYLRQKRELAERRQALLTLMDRPAYPIEMKNYSSLIDSLIKESEEVILGFHQEDLYLTSSHYRETQQISGFIQETTLSMINLELSQYHLLYQRMIDRNDALQKMGWSLYGAIFLLGMLLAYAFSNTLTRPIRQLAMAAKRIEQGDLNGENLKVPGRDELSFLTESFNRMRSNLRHMVGEIIKKSELEQELKQQALKNSEMDRLLKEMTLRSLQNQINPHFLFNTLNTLAKSAYVEGAEKTSDLITSVANLLRYTLKEREQKTTVAEEIDHVREYVTIQQARFGTRRIRVSFHLDQELLTEPLPLLTLQPIVENAFLHGIEGMEQGGEIQIHLRKEESRLTLEVRDNGKGMGEEELAHLMTRIKKEGMDPKDQRTGLGLANVWERLRLTYGEQADLRITSKKGVGTVVTLILPLQKREEKE